MNKIYNVWILIISLITLPIAFFAGINQVYGAWDIILDDYEHIDLVFGISAGLIFLLGLLRSIRKWSGMIIVNKREKFFYNEFITEKRKGRVLLLNLIEILYFMVLAIVFAIFSPKAAIISLVFFLFIIDSTINTILGISAKKYRIGMTSKAIVSADREIHAVYFKGLQRISMSDEQLVFEYINDLVLTLPFEGVSEEETEKFISLLKENLDPTKVYFKGI